MIESVPYTNFRTRYFSTYSKLDKSHINIILSGASMDGLNLYSIRTPLDDSQLLAYLENWLGMEDPQLVESRNHWRDTPEPEIQQKLREVLPTFDWTQPIAIYKFGLAIGCCEAYALAILRRAIAHREVERYEVSKTPKYGYRLTKTEKTT